MPDKEREIWKIVTEGAISLHNFDGKPWIQVSKETFEKVAEMLPEKWRFYNQAGLDEGYLNYRLSYRMGDYFVCYWDPHKTLGFRKRIDGFPA